MAFLSEAPQGVDQQQCGGSKLHLHPGSDTTNLEKPGLPTGLLYIFKFKVATVCLAVF